jgi:hypothetical protein
MPRLFMYTDRKAPENFGSRISMKCVFHQSDERPTKTLGKKHLATAGQPEWS